MSKRLRLLVVLQLVILTNWVLSKLMNELKHESIQDLDDASNFIVIRGNECALDATMSEENSRESLRTWFLRA